MDTNDARDMLAPFGSSERLARQEDFDGTDFVAQTPVVVLCAASVVRLGVFAERHDALMQIRLVGFDLRDDVSARFGHRLEGFFDSALRRR